jgi:hypothetical protein
LELLLFPVGLPIAQELTPTKSNIEAMGRPKGAAHGFVIFWGRGSDCCHGLLYEPRPLWCGGAEKNVILFEHGRY